MRTKLALAVALAAFMLAFASSALASSITLTMNEVGNQPINGLIVSKGGLDFAFSNPSGTLFYNSAGPGSVTFVQDPSIQGATAPFGVAFSAPVFTIQFGLAMSFQTSLSPLATVDLYNNSPIPFLTMSFDSTLTDPFAEGLFQYSGGPVTNILITPNQIPGALAFDNLTVDTTVPEPASLFLLGTGLAGIGIAAWRRKK
jgi:hypothetical protein